METLRDYQHTYVVSDVLLLSDVFQEFRRQSMSVYALDPAHFYTTPGLSFQACLKMTSVHMQLLTEVDQLLLIQAGLRGGVSVISSREAIANNQYIPGYDPAEPSTYIMYLDCNNLYGKSMTESLPLGGFRWMTRREIDRMDIPALDDDGEIGYILGGLTVSSTSPRRAQLLSVGA
jgi:hypothetical protein